MQAKFTHCTTFTFIQVYTEPRDKFSSPLKSFRFGISTLEIMAKMSKIEGDYELVTEKVTLDTCPPLLSYKLPIAQDNYWETRWKFYFLLVDVHSAQFQ